MELKKRRLTPIQKTPIQPGVTSDTDTPQDPVVEPVEPVIVDEPVKKKPGRPKKKE